MGQCCDAAAEAWGAGPDTALATLGPPAMVRHGSPGRGVPEPHVPRWLGAGLHTAARESEAVGWAPSVLCVLALGLCGALLRRGRPSPVWGAHGDTLSRRGAWLRAGSPRDLRASCRRVDGIFEDKGPKRDAVPASPPQRLSSLLPGPEREGPLLCRPSQSAQGDGVCNQETRGRSLGATSPGVHCLLAIFFFRAETRS